MKRGNLEEMDKFVETWNRPTLKQQKGKILRKLPTTMWNR